MRIGQGFDFHRFTPVGESRPLILAGIEVPFDRGLIGHSDADVVLHSIGDALLGTLGLGDIGQHFPDTDPNYEGADSAKLLSAMYRMVQEKGYELVNCDATIVADKPKLMSHIPQMRSSIARCLGFGEEGVDRISLKATTLEGLTAAGISCQSVVLIERR